MATWLEQMVVIQQHKDSLSKLHLGMSILKEAEASSTHKLYALQDRFAEHKAVEVAVMNAKMNVGNFIEEHERMQGAFGRIGASLFTGGQLVKWNTDLANMSFGSGTASSLVNEFLIKAGQLQLLSQLEQMETAFCIVMDKLRASLLVSLQLMGQYTSIASLYPASYKSKHRNNLYLGWLQSIMENFTADKCHEVIGQFTNELVEADASEAARLKQHQVVNLNFQLENWAEEIHFRLQKIFQRLRSEDIESSLAVQKAGLILQNDVAMYIHENGHIATAAMMKNLVEVIARLTNAEAMIDPSRFLEQTSANGDWFLLDEILMEVSLGCQIMVFLDNFGLAESKRMASLRETLKHMRLLSGSYFAIILPEGLKNFQKEDQSIIAVAKQLQDLCSTLSEENRAFSFEAVADDLEAGRSGSIEVAEAVRSKYLDLIQKCNAANPMTPGQMVLLAFNALFDNIDASLGSTEEKEDLSAFSVVQDVQTSVVIRAVLKEQAEPLRLATFMSRLAAIEEFFGLCQRAATCFDGSGSVGQLFPSGDEMGKPITQYLAGLYRRQLKGVANVAMASIITKLTGSNNSKMETTLAGMIAAFVNQNNSGGKMREMAQFLGLELNAVVANLRKLEVARQLEHTIEILQSSHQINQFQRNSFQWFHENSLPLDKVTPVAPVRPQLMTDLKACLAALLNTQSEISEIQVQLGGVYVYNLFGFHEFFYSRKNISNCTRQLNRGSNGPAERIPI